MGELVRLLVDEREILAELTALGLHDGTVPEGYKVFRHQPSPEAPRELSVIFNVETYAVDQAAFYHWGIRRWRHISVSVVGQLGYRLADQARIGRKRGPGERSGVPLPDWYDLTHIAYGHWNELGFIRTDPVFQILPPPEAEYLNIAEALHLRQPA